LGGDPQRAQRLAKLNLEIRHHLLCQAGDHGRGELLSVNQPNTSLSKVLVSLPYRILVGERT
jgi:hypothetical protein